MSKLDAVKKVLSTTESKLALAAGGVVAAFSQVASFVPKAAAMTEYHIGVRYAADIFSGRHVEEEEFVRTLDDGRCFGTQWGWFGPKEGVPTEHLHRIVQSVCDRAYPDKAPGSIMSRFEAYQDLPGVHPISGAYVSNMPNAAPPDGAYYAGGIPASEVHASTGQHLSVNLQEHLSMSDVTHEAAKHAHTGVKKASFLVGEIPQAFADTGAAHAPQVGTQLAGAATDPLLVPVFLAVMGGLGALGYVLYRRHSNKTTVQPGRF